VCICVFESVYVFISVCGSVCVCVYMCIYLFCVCVYVCDYVCVCVCVNICMFLCVIYLSMFECVYVRMIAYVYIYACVRLCGYVFMSVNVVCRKQFWSKFFLLENRKNFLVKKEKFSLFENFFVLNFMFEIFFYNLGRQF
jgi:hypothetical protein